LTDLTQGSVRRQLVKYAMPVVLSNVLQAAYSLADMYVVSHFLGTAGMSAVTNGSQIMNIFMFITIGICNGGNILVGQYFGSGEEEKHQRITGTFFSLAAILGAAGLVLLFSLAGPIMTAMGAPALQDSTAYLRICALGAFSIMGYNAMAAVLRAVGDSRTPLRCVIVSVVANVGLDLLFVGVFGWREAGAAAATAISQTLSFLMALVYFLRQKDILKLTRENFTLRREHVRRLLAVGIPSALQLTIAGISWLVVTFLINRCGMDVSAASGVSNKIKELCQLFSNAMSIAASSMIAQTLGAGLYDRAKTVMYNAMAISVAVSCVLIALVELLAPQLIALFNDEPNVVRAGVENLRIEIIGQLFYAVFLIYHAMMLGAGHTRMVMVSSFANCIVFRLVLALLFFHFWEATGIYLACMIAPSISVPIGYFYVRSGKWKNRLT